MDAGTLAIIGIWAIAIMLLIAMVSDSITF